MKFRLGLIFGLAAGYVLGAKAGYERYQQIQQKWRELRRSEPAQRLESEVRQFADRAGVRLEETANRGVDELSDTLQGSSGSGATSEPGRRFGSLGF